MIFDAIESEIRDHSNAAQATLNNLLVVKMKVLPGSTFILTTPTTIPAVPVAIHSNRQSLGLDRCVHTQLCAIN